MTTPTLEDDVDDLVASVREGRPLRSQTNRTPTALVSV